MARSYSAHRRTPGAEGEDVARRDSIRRSIQLAPTVSVSPWARIEARIVNAATSKTSEPLVDRLVEDEEREQHRRDALRAEPGDERLLRPRQTGPGERDHHRDRPGDEERERHEDEQRPDLAVVAGRDDDRAEDEERQHLEDRREVLREVDEALGDLVLRGRRARSRRRRRRSARCRTSTRRAPNAIEAEPDRVDPLVARGDAARDDRWSAAAERAQGDADQRRRTRPRRAARAPRWPASPPGRREDEEEEDEREREPSLRPDSRLSVWRIFAGTRAP